MPWRKLSVKSELARVDFRSMPVRASRPLTLVEPIVPTARPQPFNDPAWLFEPKYAGFRGMLYLTRPSCTLYSKRGNVMNRFRDLAEQLRAELGWREVILDGEIVAIRRRGKDQLLGRDARQEDVGLRCF